MLASNRRLWLVDKTLEASAPEGAVVGVRLFDAGPFHAGFGIIAEPDAETLDFCLGAKERGAPLPFRHSLAATLYGDQLRADASSEPADLALLQTLAELLTSGSSMPVKAELKHRDRQPPKSRRASKPTRG